MMNKKRLALAIACAGMLIFTAACGGGGANNGGNTGGNGGGGADTGGSNDGAVVAESPAVYAQSCLRCHGTDLEGRVGGNSNLQNVGSRLSRDEIADIIANGKQGTGMPAFGNQLDEEQINELADWLATME